MLERLPLRLSRSPRSHALSDWIQERDFAVDVCRDQRIADARQRDLKPLALFEQFLRLELERFIRRQELALCTAPRIEDTLGIFQSDRAQFFKLGVVVRD